jgi:hypothetical protein
MRTLLTGQQVTSVLCPVNRAFYFILFFLAGDYFLFLFFLAGDYLSVRHFKSRLTGEELPTGEKNSQRTDIDDGEVRYRSDLDELLGISTVSRCGGRL